MCVCACVCVCGVCIVIRLVTRLSYLYVKIAQKLPSVYSLMNHKKENKISEVLQNAQQHNYKQSEYTTISTQT